MRVEPPLSDGATLEDRLTTLARFLSERGYIAQWEKNEKGYYLHANNCPYRDISREHTEVCVMDLTTIARVLGVVPERISWTAAGENCCTYHIPFPATQPQAAPQ